MGYSFRLTARVLLYAPSHRQDSTYHGLCYASRGALAGTKHSSMGPPHEGSIQQPIAPRANALITELHLAPGMQGLQWAYSTYWLGLVCGVVLLTGSLRRGFMLCNLVPVEFTQTVSSNPVESPVYNSGPNGWLLNGLNDNGRQWAPSSSRTRSTAHLDDSPPRRQPTSTTAHLDDRLDDVMYDCKDAFALWVDRLEDCRATSEFLRGIGRNIRLNRRH